MNFQEWQDEAAYIERMVHEEPDAKFSFSDNLQHQYARMQQRAAVREGAWDAAKRIQAAIESEWPGRSERIK
jgi:hypothetical protein